MFLILGLKQLKLGIALAAAMGVVLVLSIMVFEHWVLVAWVGLGLTVLIIGYAAWLNRKAFAQNILLQEKGKARMIDVTKDEIYGDDGIADIVQSPATKKMVKAERERLRKTTVGKSATDAALS